MLNFATSPILRRASICGRPGEGPETHSQLILVAAAEADVQLSSTTEPELFKTGEVYPADGEVFGLKTRDWNAADARAQRMACEEVR
jgi:hypothetical protein